MRDPLVDSDCVVLDGHCNCPRNPRGGIPDSCKYLTGTDKPLGPVKVGPLTGKEKFEDNF